MGKNDGVAAASNRPGTCTRWSPGPGQGWQVLRAFGGGYGASIPHQRRGKWPYFGQLLTLYVNRLGRKRRGVGGFKTNRPGTYAGWSPGPRQGWLVLRAFRGGYGASIPHQRRCNWPYFGQLLTLYGQKRRGGGCFKPTWYVRKVIPRAPAGLTDASDPRRGTWGVDPAPEAG